MFANGFDKSELQAFKEQSPEVPQEAIEWFKQAETNGQIAEIEKQLQTPSE